MQVSFRKGECTSFYFIDGKLGTDVFKGLATYVFTMHYILPAVLFVIFYSRYENISCVGIKVITLLKKESSVTAIRINLHKKIAMKFTADGEYGHISYIRSF